MPLLLLQCSWNEAHLVLECPLDNSIRGKISSPFEDVVESIKYFFQFDKLTLSSISQKATALATLGNWPVNTILMYF